MGGQHGSALKKTTMCKNSTTQYKCGSSYLEAFAENYIIILFVWLSPDKVLAMRSLLLTVFSWGRVYLGDKRQTCNLRHIPLNVSRSNLYTAVLEDGSLSLQRAASLPVEKKQLLLLGGSAFTLKRNQHQVFWSKRLSPASLCLHFWHFSQPVVPVVYKRAQAAAPEFLY